MTSLHYSASLPRLCRDCWSLSSCCLLPFVSDVGELPPKSKRKLSLEKNCERAREAKRKRNSGEGTSSGSVSEVRIGDDTSLSQLVAMPDALDTDDEAVDPSFDLDWSARSDTDHYVETFCEDKLAPITLWLTTPPS